MPPADVPGYETIRCLGAGAYGEVWVAKDLNTGRTVAIKFFTHREGVDWPLLSHEVEKLVFLSADRYVVQLLDVGWDFEPPYYVMEYIDNGSLEDHLRTYGTLAVAQAVEIFREVAIGLSHAHAKGVLHCDVKPANILLDQDQKPRLADFGQSRLTSEQKPALGTLFHMAPEQADLQAVPDAKWDVYALGSVLYCMLVGQPPYRSQKVLDGLNIEDALRGRLERYRALIENADPPLGHYQVRGVDRSLARIVDRCLEVDPDRRYPHVPAILQDLAKRERAHSRRPLQVLGIVLPLLLMLTMGVFGLRAYEQAIADTQREYEELYRESNRFAAHGVSRNVASELEKRYRAIEFAAESRELIHAVKTLATVPEIKALLRELGNEELSESQREISKTTLRSASQRDALQACLQTLMNDPRQPPVASWFVTDTQGTMIASEFKSPGRSVIGDNFSYRTYFHGGIRDGKRTPVLPLKDTHLSTPFKSTATQTYKVAISRPVRDEEGVTLGVLAMTFELGQFVQFETSYDLCAVLIDGRENDYCGLILQHPLYDRLLSEYHQLPEDIDISDPDYRVNVRQLRAVDAPPQQPRRKGAMPRSTTPANVERADEAQDDRAPSTADLPSSSGARSRVADLEHPSRGLPTLYIDPLSRSPFGAKYRGDWIQATSSVRFRRTSDPSKGTFDTGLLLLVQRRRSSAIEPVKRLGNALLGEALAAICVVSLLSVALWYFVRRSLRGAFWHTQAGVGAGVDSSRFKPASVESTSVHTRETLEMPGGNGLK